MKIKKGQLVITTRECGPKDNQIAAGRNGSVIRIEGDRYLVMFGAHETARDVWLTADDIKRPPTLAELEAEKKKK